MDAEVAHVVAPVGELDLATLDALRDQLAARPGDCQAVVLDLSGLTFCDIAGVRLAIETMSEAGARGLGFALVRGSQAVQRPFAVTGTEERLPFVEALAAA